MRSRIAAPSSPGAGVRSRIDLAPAACPGARPAPKSRTSAGQAARVTDTQAVLSLSRASAIHDRSRNVLPLPAGAETMTTRAASASRWTSSPRLTMPPLTAACDRSACTAGQSSHRPNQSMRMRNSHPARANDASMANPRISLTGWTLLDGDRMAASTRDSPPPTCRAPALRSSTVTTKGSTTGPTEQEKHAR